MPDIVVNPKPTPPALMPATHMSFFTTLCRNPDGVRYADQDQDETIILFLRRHLVTNIGWVTGTIILLILPLLLPFFFMDIITTLGLPTLYIGILIALYYLFVAGFTLYQLVSWFYNISLVSNKKVVDIDYHSLTAKDISATTLDSVEDIKYQQGGVFKTQWNFGNVEILTQAQGSEINFEDVPQPAHVVDIILDMKGAITERG